MLRLVPHARRSDTRTRLCVGEGGRSTAQSASCFEAPPVRGPRKNAARCRKRAAVSSSPEHPCVHVVRFCGALPSEVTVTATLRHLLAVQEEGIPGLRQLSRRLEEPWLPRRLSPSDSTVVFPAMVPRCHQHPSANCKSRFLNHPEPSALGLLLRTQNKAVVACVPAVQLSTAHKVRGPTEGLRWGPGVWPFQGPVRPQKGSPGGRPMHWWAMGLQHQSPPVTSDPHVSQQPAMGRGGRGALAGAGQGRWLCGVVGPQPLRD